MSNSSTILLYGVCRADSQTAVDEALHSCPGVQDAPLTLVRSGALAAIVSPVDRSLLRSPSTDTVLAYHDVIESAYATAPVVPFRFGTQAASSEEVQALVARHRAPLTAHLTRFEGQVEMGVRLELTETASAPASSSVDAASGRAYLEARRDARAKATATLDDLIDVYRTAVGAASADTTCDRRDDDARVVSLAFLVSEAQAAAVRDRLANASPDGVAEAHVVGPWAPYSFVDL